MSAIPDTIQNGVAPAMKSRASCAVSAAVSAPLASPAVIVPAKIPTPKARAHKISSQAVPSNNGRRFFLFSILRT